MRYQNFYYESIVYKIMLPAMCEVIVFCFEKIIAIVVTVVRNQQYRILVVNKISFKTIHFKDNT